MEPFSQKTLTILVLVGVILSGIAFIAVTILIFCLIHSKKHRSGVVSPVNTRSIASPNSYTRRSLSVSSSLSIPIKNSVVTSSTQRQVQQPRLRKYTHDTISVLDEYSSDDQNKHRSANKRNETTIRDESRINKQQQQQPQQPFQTATNVQFNDRRTPYPPDVLARERLMMAHLRIPNGDKHNQY